MQKKYKVSGKIGILDADLMDGGTRHPNLALMKIAGYFYELGNEVKLIYKDYNEVREYKRVFISKVFDFTDIPDWVVEQKNVFRGGTGFFPDGGEKLPDEIEHHKPYYDLYREFVEEQLAAGRSRTVFADYLDYSIGFTTRGCFRKCSFCVNKKYDHVLLHSPVSEFLDESRPYIYLWDDNILGFHGKWRAVLNELAASGKPFQFRQGIDLRLMTDEMAKVLNSLQYHGDFIFAFDHIDDRDLIIEKIQLWRRYSQKTSKFYVLSGFNSQEEEDITNVFERIAILMTYGSIPYIMRHNNYLQSKYKNVYIQLARWCNQPRFFKKMSFRQFCQANQDYKKDQNTDCAAYSALKMFEHDFPEIAKKYFDLKYEEMNSYSDQYGYSRKYCNKQLCKECHKKGLYWGELFEDNVKLLNLYFNREIDIECLHYPISECINQKDEIINKFVELLESTSINEIVQTIDIKEQVEVVICFNDMFAYIKRAIEKLELLNGVNGLKTIICSINDDLSDQQLLKLESDLCKVLSSIDLCKYRPRRGISDIRLSSLGKMLATKTVSVRKRVIARILFRLPIIQQYLLQCDKSDFTNINMSRIEMTRKEKEEVKSIMDFIIKNEGVK